MANGNEEIPPEIARLQSILEKVGTEKRWTKRELAKVAPYYKGKVEHFSLTQYIESSKQIIRQHPGSLSSLKKAIMQLFHATYPHPIRYRDEKGKIEVSSFEVDFKIWLTTVITTWSMLDETMHHDHCKCCILFSQAATSYQDDFKKLMNEENKSKRVYRVDIIKWGNMLSTSGATEVFQSLREVAKALWEGRDHPRLSSEKSEKQYQHSPTPVQVIVIPHISKVVTLDMPKNNKSLKRDMTTYARIFFETLLKVNTYFSAYELMPERNRRHNIIKQHNDYVESANSIKILIFGKKPTNTIGGKKRKNRMNQNRR